MNANSEDGENKRSVGSAQVEGRAETYLKDVALGELTTSNSELEALHPADSGVSLEMNGYGDLPSTGTLRGSPHGDAMSDIKSFVGQYTAGLGGSDNTIVEDSPAVRMQTIREQKG